VTQQRILVRGLKGLLAAQSAVPRFTSVESAPRLALDQVTAEARPTGMANKVARVTLDKAKKGGTFCSGQTKEETHPANELDQLRAVYDAPQVEVSYALSLAR